MKARQVLWVVLALLGGIGCGADEVDDVDAGPTGGSGGSGGQGGQGGQGGLMPGPAAGACQDESSCMVLCTDDQAVIDTARQACSGDRTWLPGSDCPMEDALGVCEVDALYCLQFCVPDPDLDDAERLDVCREVCGGKFSEF